MSKKPQQQTTKKSTLFFRNLSRIFKYGIIGFGRNIWLSLTATIVTTITLVLLLVTIVAGVILSDTASIMRDKIDITIFFNPKTTASELNTLANIIKRDNNVKSVNYATGEQEYNKLLEETKARNDTELLTTLTDEVMGEIMLKTMNSTMRLKVYNADDLSSIKNIVHTNETFKKYLDTTKEPTYNTNDSAIKTISNWANTATQGGIALCALFLVISILVIFNTIRMAIYSRSEEIYMEKLVGAENSFIRGPFLVEAGLSGILAGIFSLIISFAIYNTALPKLKSYDISVQIISNFLNSVENIIFLIVILIFTGIIIALTSSRLAIHKYLRKF